MSGATVAGAVAVTAAAAGVGIYGYFNNWFAGVGLPSPTAQQAQAAARAAAYRASAARRAGAVTGPSGNRRVIDELSY